MSGQIFKSEKWFGFGLGVGGSVGGIPVGPGAITFDLAGLFFRPYGEVWNEGENFYDFHENRCICMALRAVTRNSADDLVGLIRLLFE